jgi:hypothetical protein
MGTPGDAAPIVLSARFNGPPSTANGGYACGVVAAALGRPLGPVAVRLHRPVPLERPLTVLTEETGGNATVTLCSGDQLVATGTIASIELPDPPARPSLAAATAARRRHPGFAVDHPLARCFVCGEDRLDGLHVSAGPLAADGSGDVIASPFEPDDSFGTVGVVDPPVVWGALDCPSYPMPAVRAGRTCLLGTFRARITRDVRTGERLVAVGWTNREDGRKFLCGSALLDDTGALVAASEAVWIAVSDEYVRSAGSG